MAHQSPSSHKISSFIFPTVLLLQACVVSGTESSTLSAQERKRTYTQQSTLSEVQAVYRGPEVTQIYRDYFGELEKAIDRDIGGHLGTATDIVPKLLKRALRLDYEGQLAVLKKAQDKTAAIKEIVELAQAAHFLVPAVCQWLLKILQDADWYVHDAAAKALVKLARVKPTANNCDVLLKAAEHDSTWVRNAITTTLVALVKASPTAENRDLLLQAIESGGVYVREVATTPFVELLKLSPTTGSCDALLKILGNAHRRVRLVAAKASGELIKVAPQFVPNLRNALIKAVGDARNDSSGEARKAAVTALGEFSKAASEYTNNEVYEALLKAAGCSNWRIRYATATALGELGKAAPQFLPNVRDALLKAAQDTHWYVRNAAIAALKELNKAALTAENRDALLKNAEDSNKYVRLAVVSTIGALIQTAPQLANHQACDMLIKAAGDGTSFVRTAAMSALEQLFKVVSASEVVENREALLKVISSTNWETSCEASFKALVVIAKIEPQFASTVRDVLLNTTQDLDLDVRHAAAAALKILEGVIK